jgi:hypothetical protein
MLLLCYDAAAVPGVLLHRHPCCSCAAICSGVLGFQDVLEVDRLLLESSQGSAAAPAACSIEGFGTYGEPVYSMVVEQPLAGEATTATAASAGNNQPSSSGSSSSGMRLPAPAGAAAAADDDDSALGDSTTPGAYSLAAEANTDANSSSSRDAQERIMLQEDALQDNAVRQLTTCTPLLTSGRLLGIGGLANCTVSVSVLSMVLCSTSVAQLPRRRSTQQREKGCFQLTYVRIVLTYGWKS